MILSAESSTKDFNYNESVAGFREGDRRNVTMDPSFCLKTAIDMIDDPDPNNIKQARLRPDWNKWKEAIESEFRSLHSRSVFGTVLEAPPDKTIGGHRWVFTKKRNDKGEVIRYKARLVAQGFTLVPGQDYSQTYSPVMDATTFRFITAFATLESFTMRLMDVVTANLYGDLDSEIYMKIPEGLVAEKHLAKFRNACVRLKRSIYGLKQAERMWLHRLATFLTSQISRCTFRQEFIS